MENLKKAHNNLHVLHILLMSTLGTRLKLQGQVWVSRQYNPKWYPSSMTNRTHQSIYRIPFHFKETTNANLKMDWASKVDKLAQEARGQKLKPLTNPILEDQGTLGNAGVNCQFNSLLWSITQPGWRPIKLCQWQAGHPLAWFMDWQSVGCFHTLSTVIPIVNRVERFSSL